MHWSEAAHPPPSGECQSLTTSSVDLTRDARPDLHVANEFNRDAVCVNRGNGQFATVAVKRGVERDDQG